MVIKNYKLNKEQTKSRIAKILEYKTQAQAFRKLQIESPSKRGYKNHSSLATLLPLVAASLSPFALMAQPCGNNAAGTIANCPNAGLLEIDLEGDGTMDLIINTTTDGSSIRFASGFTWLTAGYEIAPYAYFDAYAIGATIDGANVNTPPRAAVQGMVCSGATSGYGWLAYDAYNTGGWDGGDGSTPLVFAFSRDGVLGFVEITYDDDPSNSVVIGEFGIADDATITSITAGDCNSLQTALPLELITFSGEIDGEIARLSWITTAEEGVAGMEIERSVDGRSFHKIGYVEAKGVSGVTSEYSFDDRDDKSNQTYYYRLKIIDQSESFEYSKTVVLTYNDGESNTVKDIFPNPSNNDIADLIIVSNQAQKATAVVYDVMGKVVFQKTSNIIEGTNNVRLDLKNANAGQHFVHITFENGESYYKRLMIAKD